MRIDFHAHIRQGQGEPEALIDAMDRSGVDKMVLHPIVPTADGLGSSSNEFIAEVVARFPDRFLGFACVVPTDPRAPEALAQLIETYGFRGLKLHPPIQQFDLRDTSIYPTLRVAAELGLPVLIHTGPIFVTSARMTFGDPAAIDEIALNFPSLIIVAAHADPFAAQPVLAGKHSNVYTDTAVVFDRYVRLIPGVGEDMLNWMAIGGQDPYSKLLFGTDANPLNTARLTRTLESILQLDIGKEQQDAILGGNAERILGLAAQ